MRTLIIALIFISTQTFAATTKIEVGALSSDAIGNLKKIGAKDITGGMEVIGLNGEWPLKEIYWELSGYGIIVELSTAKEQVTGICFWKNADFSVNKTHREDTRCYVQSISFDIEKKTLQIEKKYFSEK